MEHSQFNNWRQVTRSAALLKVLAPSLFLSALLLALPLHAYSPVPEVINWERLDPRSVEDVHTDMKMRAVLAKEKAYSESRLNARMVALYSEMNPPKDTALVMEKASRTYSVDSRLLLSLCVVESSLRPDATSKAGATGLCQVVPKWHNVTRKEMLDYRKNVDKSAEHLSELIGKCRGNLKCAIHSYNVGYTGYLQGARANAYVSKVLAEYRRSI